MAPPGTYGNIRNYSTNPDDNNTSLLSVNPDNAFQPSTTFGKTAGFGYPSVGAVKTNDAFAGGYGTDGAGTFDFSNLSVDGAGGGGTGSIFNAGNLNAAGGILGGVGKLASAWAALKGVGIAEDQLQANKDQYAQQFAANRTQTNNNTRLTNAFLTAQGREADHGKFIA